MFKKVVVLFILLFAFNAYPEESGTVELESVEVSAEKIKQFGTEVTRSEMEKTGAQDLYHAVGRIPGVNLSEGGARGESSFSIRGFDSSYIPVIVDGISVSSPFNGLGDSGSLLTGDMSRIIVQKGYSSMLMGANGMGGAVLLEISKPADMFEAFLKSTAEFDDRFELASTNFVTSVGSRLEKFYFKATVQDRDMDHFRLPDGYVPIQGSVQPQGCRLYSDRDDFKTTLIAGTTPVNGLDIWATYIYQKSDRGMNPPETGPVYALWGWDYWKYQSASLHGEYNDPDWDLSFVVFYDTYANSVSSYSSFIHVDYNRPNRTTEYDEYAAGARFNIGYNIAGKHFLRGALSFRQDDHWSYRADLIDKNDIHVKENKLSFGLEYEYRPLQRLRFIVSGGFDSLLPDDYWSRTGAFAEYMGVSSYEIEKKDRWLLAAQAGIFYEFIDNNELRLTYARRNQFPTMSERYSTRFGDFMPNPNLKPEVADHAELGYNGSLFGIWLLDAAIYYSVVNDKMAVIKVPDPFDSSHSVDFTTNLDSVSFYGFEFSSALLLSRYLETGINLSLSDYNVNKSRSKAKTVTYYPKITVNAYAEIKPWEDYISVMPVVEYRDKRWTDIYETGYLDPYTLFHLYVTFNINDYFKIDAAILNITDELYELRQNYPLAGRTYSLSATIRY